MNGNHQAGTIKVGNKDGRVLIGLGESAFAFDAPEALALASLLIRHASEIWAGRQMVDRIIEKSPVDSPPQS